MSKNSDNPYAAYARYSVLALLLPLATFIGYVIGYYLDRLFGTHFLKIGFLIFGVAAGFLELFRELNRDEPGK